MPPADCALSFCFVILAFLFSSNSRLRFSRAAVLPPFGPDELSFGLSSSIFPSSLLSELRCCRLVVLSSSVLPSIRFFLRSVRSRFSFCLLRRSSSRRFLRSSFRFSSLSRLFVFFLALQKYLCQFFDCL